MNDINRKEAGVMLKHNMELIVNNILNSLEKSKMSQKELALRIGSEPPHVNYILRKSSGITINVLGRIAVALNTTISELTRNQTTPNLFTPKPPQV